MNALTYEQLFNELERETDTLVSLVRVASLPINFIAAISMLQNIISTSRKQIRILNDIEKTYCVKCGNMECVLKTKKHLESLVSLMGPVPERIRKSGFLMRYFAGKIEELIEEFESKLENYQIASDPEIQKLAGTLARL